jgi:hypothetical protein
MYASSRKISEATGPAHNKKMTIDSGVGSGDFTLYFSPAASPLTLLEAIVSSEWITLMSVRDYANTERDRRLSPHP